MDKLYFAIAPFLNSKIFSFFSQFLPCKPLSVKDHAGLHNFSGNSLPAQVKRFSSLSDSGA
ncbi:hypothetical protein, partial [Desulfopila inferna]|uniref:hypothetical protein n=1 Tax=Desulfopila inferna TaxID=468528 RepID=UPI001964BC05